MNSIIPCLKDTNFLEKMRNRDKELQGWVVSWGAGKGLVSGTRGHS